MAYSTVPSEFFSIARQLDSDRKSVRQMSRSNGSELVPTEARSRMNREGESFLQRPAINGATVDQEGLTNNYAVEPTMYFSLFPSPQQARQYALQGVAATLLVVGLIMTSFAVS